VLLQNRKDIGEGRGTLLSWHTSEALAQKAVTKWQQEGHWCYVQVVPVTSRVLGTDARLNVR
jgi:hypothetical protein